MVAALLVLVGASAAAPDQGGHPQVPSALSWGGKAFHDPHGLAEWLRERGLSYETWARNHPFAAARLESREQGLSSAPAPAPLPVNSPPAVVVTLPPSEPAPRDVANLLLMSGLAALSGILLLLALLPLPHFPRVRVPGVVETRQAELAGAGVAIAIAAGIAYFL